MHRSASYAPSRSVGKDSLQGPLKRVLEGVVLTPHQAAEADEIVLERDLVFGLEIPAIERRVVGAEAEVDPSLIQPLCHLTHWSEVCEGAGLQVGARTEFEADAALAHLWQQVRQVERDLHAVPDTAKIRKQRRMHVLGSCLAEMGGSREIVLGSLAVQAHKMGEPRSQWLFRTSHVDAAHEVAPRQGQIYRGGVNV